MNFSTLLCKIFYKFNGEKTAYAVYHLLRGKRSGQTLQDVEYYNLKMYFGILPKLKKTLFDEAIEEIYQLQYISIDDSARLWLTDKGKHIVQSSRPYRFNGWEYRGREIIFFARLSLIVQTASHFRINQKSFMPAQRDVEIQFFVRNLLSGLAIQEPSFSKKLKEELEESIVRSGMEEIQKIIFTHRLIGCRHTGWTWGQLAKELAISPLSAKLYFIESLHLILQSIEQLENSSLLKKAASSIKIESPLTESAKKTKELFDKGLTLEEIALNRRLKQSTIEDHIVEFAINEENFPLDYFVPSNERDLVYKKAGELNTKRLRVLKEAFPHLSYFQLRLILAAVPEGGF